MQPELARGLELLLRSVLDLILETGRKMRAYKDVQALVHRFLGICKENPQPLPGNLCAQ